MVGEALKHSKAFPDSPLEEIRFIVHTDDREGISNFEEKFRGLKEERQGILTPRSPANGHCRRKKKPILSGPTCTKVRVGCSTLEVVKGDITKESSDGIVNILRDDLQMKNGTLSAFIANASGAVVQKELTASFPQACGSIVTTSAGNLAAKCILHMVVRSNNKQHLQTCVLAALKEAHSRDLKSVSIPAIGSGRFRLSPRESAEVVLGAVRSFFEAGNLSNTLREIRILVIDDSVEDAFTCLLKQLTTETEFCGLAEEGGEEGQIDTKGMAKCYQHKVVVYGRHEVLDDAIAAITNGVIKEFQSIDVTDDVIPRLPKRCIRELRRNGRTEDVSLDLFEPGIITLHGFPTDVLRMHTEVSKVIQDQLKKEHTIERAEMTARNVEWCYLSVTGKQEPFEKMANYEIETASQSKRPSVSFTHKNLNAEIVFDLEQVTFLKTRAVKKIFRKEGESLFWARVSLNSDNQSSEEMEITTVLSGFQTGAVCTGAVQPKTLYLSARVTRRLL